MDRERDIGAQFYSSFLKRRADRVLGLSCLLGDVGEWESFPVEFSEILRNSTVSIIGNLNDYMNLEGFS